MIAALGIDVGSTTTKLVGLDAEGARVWDHLEPTDPHMASQAERLLAGAHEQAGGGEIPVVATGYGRKLVPGARSVTEITCHGRGAYRAMGHGGTVIDIGGQDSKVIRIDGKGKVLDFAMNDKCAAGTGRFLEVAADRLRLPLDRMGPTALAADRAARISSTCVVFAESEMISMLARGESLEPIVRGLHLSLVQRVLSLARSAGLRAPVVLSGGVALNSAVVFLIRQAVTGPVEVPDRPQYLGALGAAELALEERT